jgi:hypothetical protein
MFGLYISEAFVSEEETQNFFSDTTLALHYKTVFSYFRKWCKSGFIRQIWAIILDRYRGSLDMFSVDLDGSHTTALRGGEQVAYQGRKKKKTTNALYLTDRQGIPLVMSDPIEGNHNDLRQIKERFTDIIDILDKSNIKS